VETFAQFVENVSTLCSTSVDNKEAKFRFFSCGGFVALPPVQTDAGLSVFTDPTTLFPLPPLFAGPFFVAIRLQEFFGGSVLCDVPKIARFFFLAFGT